MAKKEEYNFSGKKPRQNDGDTAISNKVELSAKEEKNKKKLSK